MKLVISTRKSPHLVLGASPRASLALFRLGQASALLAGRKYVLPDDIKKMAFPVLGHRVIVKPESRLRKFTPRSIIRDILNEVANNTGLTKIGVDAINTELAKKLKLVSNKMDLKINERKNQLKNEINALMRYK